MWLYNFCIGSPPFNNHFVATPAVPIPQTVNRHISIRVASRALPLPRRLRAKAAAPPPPHRRTCLATGPAKAKAAQVAPLSLYYHEHRITSLRSSSSGSGWSMFFIVCFTGIKYNVKMRYQIVLCDGSSWKVCRPRINKWCKDAKWCDGVTCRCCRGVLNWNGCSLRILKLIHKCIVVMHCRNEFYSDDLIWRSRHVSNAEH